MRLFPLLSLSGVLLAGLILVEAQEKKPDAPLVAMLGDSPARNQVNLVEKNIPDDFSVTKGKLKHVKWMVSLGLKSYSPPVVAGDRLFIATDNKKPRDPRIIGKRGVMLCLRVSDGSLLWQHTFERGPQPNDVDEEPLISSPYVEGNRLWYVNNLCEIICSDIQGKILWKYDMVKEHNVFVGQHVYSSPLVIGDLVYAITSNGRDGSTNKLPEPKAPALVAVNKTTGKFAWANAAPGANIIRGQWTNPSAATINGKTQVIYGGGDGWLYGLDARSGELIWKFDCNPKKFKPYRVGGSGEQAFIIASPVVYDNKCYIGVGQEPDDGPGVGHLWCIDLSKKPTNKEKDLSPVGDNFDPKAPVNKNSGLVWHVGGMIVPRPMGNAREWHFGRTLGTVAVHDGLVYAGEFAGYLYCFDAKTGEKYWEYDFNDTTWCSPYYVDGKIFFGVDAGELYIFKPGKKLSTPRKITIGPPVKLPPVAANGVLYINTGSNLYAISKK